MIRALVLLAFWGVSILIVGPVLLLYAFISGDINPLYNISARLAIFGVRLVGVKIDVRGMENLEAGHNYIFMANHTSNLDPPVLLPTIPGRCSVLVKKELFRIPILGIGMKMASPRTGRSQRSRVRYRERECGHRRLAPGTAHADLSGRHAFQRWPTAAFQEGTISPGDRFGSVRRSSDDAGNV